MKFRVWHKKLNKFLKDSALFINKHYVFIINKGQRDRDYICTIYEIGKEVEIDWGFEYKGKEYYENDIVKMGEHNAVLKYSSECLLWVWVYNNMVANVDMLEIEGDWFPIIGNLRENLELMEKL